MCSIRRQTAIAELSVFGGPERLPASALQLPAWGELPSTCFLWRLEASQTGDGRELREEEHASPPHSAWPGMAWNFLNPSYQLAQADTLWQQALYPYSFFCVTKNIMDSIWRGSMCCCFGAQAWGPLHGPGAELLLHSSSTCHPKGRFQSQAASLILEKLKSMLLYTHQGALKHDLLVDMYHLF